jgi:hypothetical protein
MRVAALAFESVAVKASVQLYRIPTSVIGFPGDDSLGTDGTFTSFSKATQPR